MSNHGTIERYKQYVMPTYAPEILLVRGEGARVWDVDGKRYLDFASGISVCNLGHCHPTVTAAIREQAGTLVHVSNLYMNERQPELAAKLVNFGFDGLAFFANSGAEANEGMLKFARRWGAADGRYEVIAMEHSFHGRTLATLAATGQEKYRKGFAPDMPGFRHVPFNDSDAVAASIGEKTVAVLVEPVQGEGGVLPADPAYLRRLRQLCDERNLLLLFDEVQCGMGRTGSFFAFQHFGVEPDALSLAKALGNGFPIGAFLVRRKYAGILDVGSHASTFGGTPLACAAACAVLDAFKQENVLQNCRSMGERILDRLNQLKGLYPNLVKDVRGIGLMIGIEVAAPELAKRAVALLRQRAMLALTAGANVVRLLPPLTISEEELEEGVSILADAFAELDSEQKRIEDTTANRIGGTV